MRIFYILIFFIIYTSAATAQNKIYLIDSAVFPLLRLKDHLKNNIAFEPGKIRSKYTLIDFWPDNYGPCLLKFSQYQGIYNEYTRQQFQIVGISIDASDLSIQALPANFLLNEKGEIIKRNLSPAEVEQFLFEENEKGIFYFANYEPD
jgi:hypothetical protein